MWDSCIGEGNRIVNNRGDLGTPSYARFYESAQAHRDIMSADSSYHPHTNKKHLKKNMCAEEFQKETVNCQPKASTTMMHIN